MPENFKYILIVKLIEQSRQCLESCSRCM